MNAPENATEARIRAMLAELDRVTPAAPEFGDLRPSESRNRSRIIPVAAAVALVVVGIGGVVAISGDEAEPVGPGVSTRPVATEPIRTEPASTETGSTEPTAPESGPTSTPDATTDPASSTIAEQSGQDAEPATGPRLLTTELDPFTTPLFTLPGWETTYAYSDEDLDRYRAYENASVLVGDGPMYDAPLFVATSGTREELFGPEVFADDFSGSGDQIEIGGRSGAVEVRQTDPDTQLDGPIVTLSWGLEDGRVARANTVHLEVDQAIDLATRYSDAVEDGSNAVFRPDGYRQLALPTHDDHRSFEYQFELDGRSLQIIGENQGVSSLLGRIVNEVRTTRTVDGVEMAYRPLPDSPGRYWVDWQTGDWSFYVDADGFDSEEEFFDAISALELADASTVEATGDDIVTPQNRAAVVDQLLVDVPVPPGIDVAALREATGAQIRYSEITRVSGAVACGWLDEYFTARDTGDDGAAQSAADALATSTEWDMLIEIDDQGGWSSVLWDTAGAVNGEGGIPTGNGPEEPTRENTGSGLGCDFG